ncbi:MAG: PocR ligand-binding domain-containing protein [Clostridia bacterium]|nr:PocR ligand-binding domain-containing protein [Clostridia bacterium]
MIIVYDSDKLNKVFQTFANVMRTKVTFIDKNFNLIGFENYKRREFCFKLFEDETEHLKCTQNYHNNLRMLNEEKKEYHLMCRLGCMDCHYPLFIDDTFVGYIQYGSMRTCKKLSDTGYEFGSSTKQLDELAKLYEESEYFEPERIESIHDIVKILADYILKNGLIRIKHNELIERAEIYIENHLGERLTVENICKALAVSKNSLYTNFSKELSCSVNDYITQKRMECSKHLLTSTQKTINEICTEIGISDSSYFSKVFKKKTGMSALEFRKQFSVEYGG